MAKKSPTQKRKARTLKIKATIYLLACIGAWTVGVNAFEATKSAYDHACSWAHSIELKAPIAFKGES
jgi:hypothetical protein